MKSKLWNYYCNIILSYFILGGSADLSFITVPKGIELSTQTPSIKHGEISSIINYLMGMPLSGEVKWKGITQVDLFNRPKANLFLNLYVASAESFSVLHAARYVMSEQEIPSLQSTNGALFHLYQDEEPMMVQFETDGSLFSISKLNADMLNDLPATLDSMKRRLGEESSIIKSLKVDSCLRPDNDADATFLGELQTLSDILTKLTDSKQSVVDDAADTFYFSLTGLKVVVDQHGAESCQVKSAQRLLQEFLPEYIMSFNQLYAGRLLSEVSTTQFVGRSFADISVRHVRSLQSTDDKNDTAPIKNGVSPLPEDYPVVVNLTFWVVVVFALATLASSYGIWYMNPGWDSVIYRMTNQRLKSD